MPGLPARPRLKQLVAVVLGIGVVAYPVAVYAGLTRTGPRTAALLLLLLFVPAAGLRVARLKSEKLTTLALLPLVTVSLLFVSALLDRGGYILAVPAVMNLLLLVTFGSTLRYGPPMIERFARLKEPDLSDEKVRWCRAWTLVWCAFFVVNGSTAALLAGFAPLEVWTAYTGLVAYALMGLLFAVEWTLRRLRFGASVGAPR
jgi:uncharacterized membrane protein